MQLPSAPAHDVSAISKQMRRLSSIRACRSQEWPTKAPTTCMMLARSARAERRRAYGMNDNAVVRRNAADGQALRSSCKACACLDELEEPFVGDGSRKPQWMVGSQGNPCRLVWMEKKSKKVPTLMGSAMRHRNISLDISSFSGALSSVSYTPTALQLFFAVTNSIGLSR